MTQGLGLDHMSRSNISLIGEGDLFIRGTFKEKIIRGKQYGFALSCHLFVCVDTFRRVRRTNMSLSFQLEAGFPGIFFQSNGAKG